MTDYEAEQCHIAHAPPLCWNLVRRKTGGPFVYVRETNGRDPGKPLCIWYGGDCRWLNEALGEALVRPRPMTDEGVPGVARIEGPPGWSVLVDGGDMRLVSIEREGVVMATLTRPQVAGLRLRLLQIATLAEIREAEWREQNEA